VSEDLLGIDEIKEILVQALPLGLEFVKLTGGEPFLRTDVVDIVRAAGQMGVKTRIETNGTLITEEVAQELGILDNLSHLALSIDGATAESHVLLRRSQGSYAAALRGARMLVGHGVKLQIVTSIHKANVGEIGDMARLASELGAASLKLNPVVKVGRGADMAEEGRLLEMAEVLSLAGRLAQGAHADAGVPIQMTLPVAFLPLDLLRRQRFNECGVMNLLGVLPDGSLSICGVGEENKDLIFGSARESGIAEVWTSSPGLHAIRQEIRQWPTGICERCLVRSYCAWGYCRADAFAHTGSLSAPASFCQECYDAGLFPASRLL
jgi:SynChlorMet cassette radical SAM/SPASM protein ScmF